MAISPSFVACVFLLICIVQGFCSSIDIKKQCYEDSEEETYTQESGGIYKGRDYNLASEYSL